MIHSARVAVATLFAMNPCACFAQGIAIKVMDEKNTGIYSQVFYEEQTTPRPFWTTDQKGELQKPSPCGKTHSLKAHPFDSGTYFDSLEVPCTTKITLRVVSRSTPKWTAINWKLEPIKFSDGSPGVIVLKAGLETSLNDQLDSQQCEVTLNAVANQEAYRVDGDR